MEERKRVWFIVNPISGTGDKRYVLELIPQYMDARQFIYEIKLTDHRGHAAE
jgi:diacylglycerol kinase family enzyme